MAKVRKKLSIADKLTLGHVSENDRPKLSKYAAKQPEVREKLAVVQGSGHFDSLRRLLVEQDVGKEYRQGTGSQGTPLRDTVSDLETIE